MAIADSAFRLFALWQVVMLRQHKASGRLIVLVQALTAPRLAAADPCAAAAVPAPLQARPQEPLTVDTFVPCMPCRMNPATPISGPWRCA